MINNYHYDSEGVIHQTEFNIITYNAEYINTRYPAYKEKCINMGYLRLGYIVGSLGFIPKSILDVGYGAGDFLSACTNIIPHCYGFDVTGMPAPQGVTVVESLYDKHYDVVTFFDVLEHFPDINEIQSLDTKYIVVSLPWCHYYNDEWFTNWKHRRPNEHLHHFNETSLISFFQKHNYSCLNYSNIEDSIRQGSPKNILTATFKRNGI